MMRLDSKGNPRRPKIFEVRDDFLEFSPLADKLLYHEGQKIFYRYEDLHYIPMSEEEMFTIIDSFIVSSYRTLFDVTNSNVKEIYTSLTRLASSPLQSFRKVDKDFLPTLSAFDDGVFDFSKPRSPLLPHDPNLPVFHRFPFAFPLISSPVGDDMSETPTTPTPHFDAYLESTFVKEDGSPDPELADFMITVLAYYTSPVTPPNPIAVILTGSGSNGKSVFLDLLRCIVGNNFTASITMEALSERFGSSALVGKLLNIVSEDQSKYIDAGRIKALISQEHIQLERKFENPGTFKPCAKHFFSTNKDLKFSEIDYATSRRIASIPFFRTFVPKDSPYIDGNLVVPYINDLITKDSKSIFSGKLVRELPAIMEKLIKRIIEMSEENFEIRFPQAVLLKQKEIESASTTALDFIHTHYTIDPTCEDLVSTEEVFNEYQTWYDKIYTTQKYKLNTRSFWAIVTKNFPATRTEKKIHSTPLNKTTAAKKGLRRKDSEDVVYAI